MSESTNKPFDLETLLEDKPVMEMVGFALASKVNGRIVSNSMKVAFRQSRLPKGNGIDGFNELMKELKDIEADNHHFDANGFTPAADPVDELAQWLGVRYRLVEAGVKVQPLSDNFEFILTRAASKSVDEAQLAKLAELSGRKADELKAVFEAKNAKDFGETRERVLSALRIINDTTPDTTSVPEGLAELVSEAFTAGQKSAVVMANDPTEAIANLILLKATEDSQL